MSLSTELLARSDRGPAREGPAADAFVTGIARLLLTFFSVVVVDVVVVSLATHRLRFWFPLWLDPQWATRPDPWVIYSQSYCAGIFLIPIFCWLIDREFLVTAGRGARLVFWSLCLGAFALILWWKGSLMLEYDKHYEAMGWAALTGIMWVISGPFADRWAGRLRGVTRGHMLGSLLFWVAVFFLVMSGVDPFLQVGVQHLPWSWGLTIEVGFFLPAGVVLMTLSRRLGASRGRHAGRRKTVRSVASKP